MDPLISVGLGAGSTLLSSMFGSNAQDAVNAERLRVTQAERQRQQALDAEASGINARALNRYGGFDTQLGKRGLELADLYRTASVPGGSATSSGVPQVALPAASSDLIAREIAAQGDLARAYVNQQGEALGKLRAFGDLFGGIQRGQARDAGTIGQIGGYKKSSAGVQALELDAANHAGDSQKFMSDIFGGFGKVGLTAGLGQLFINDGPLDIRPAVARVAPAKIGEMFAASPTIFNAHTLY